MFSNLIYKTLYSSNRKVLKCISTLCVKNSKYINISTRKLVILNNYGIQNCDENIIELRENTLILSKEMRESMTKTGKYNSYMPKILPNDDLINAKFIQNIKLKNWSLFSNAECLNNFRMLSIYAMKNYECITNNSYAHIISELSLKCLKFSDEELLNFLRYLELWPNISQVKQLKFRSFLVKLDNDLVNRSKFWHKEKTLIFCDITCKLFNFQSNFVQSSIQYLMSISNKLSSTDIVQMLYFQYIHPCPNLNISQLEFYIENYFHLYEIAELQVICTGFFRSETRISNTNLLYNLLKFCINNITNINDNELSQFLKIFRMSFIVEPVFLDLYEKLLKTLIPVVPRVGGLTLTQITHLFARTLIYNPILMSAIIKRSPELLKTLRIKDIARILLLLTTFNYPLNKPLYETLINELRNSQRSEEKKLYPQEYGFALRYLSHVNIYPLDLISYVMGPEYKNLAYGWDPNEIGVENFVLDQSMKIEVPHYNGPKLNNKVCKYMSNKIGTELDTFGNRASRKIVKLLNEKYHKDVACFYRILPHFVQKDIILCLDNFNNAISALPQLEKIEGIIKWAPTTSKIHYWIAFIFVTQTNIIRNTKEFTGLLCMKMRQLRKVGYIPVVIPVYEWKTLHYDKEQSEYLEKKILFARRQLFDRKKE